MRNSFKNTWLSICLLASVTMIGCGGGGGSSNPAAPVQQVSNEARVAQAVVTPVYQNASSIINGPVQASGRLSIGNTNSLTSREINANVISAMQAPNYLRAVISAVGGNIEKGLWVDESRDLSYSEVATYSNGVYERTVYYDNPDDIIKNGENSFGGRLEDNIFSYYKIEGCTADFEKDGKTLCGLKINSGAKITVDERRGFRFGSLKVIDGYGLYTPMSFKGTINTDLVVSWEGKEEPPFDSPRVFEVENDNGYVPTSTGKDITEDYKSYKKGIQASKLINSKTTYSFTKLEMNLSDIKVSNEKSGYTYDYNGNLKISINGINGNIIENKRILVDARPVYSKEDGWEFYNEKLIYYSDDSYDYEYDEETGEEIEKLKDDAKEYNYYSNVINVWKTISNLKFNNPVTISLSADSDSFITSNYDWYTYEQKKIREDSGTIKDITVKINKISGDFNHLVIDDAEAHVETGDYKTEEVIMIGDQEVVFNKAIIDIKGLKYNYAWENDESLTEEEFNKKCFGNTKVHIEAEEKINSVTMKADLDINAKTATMNLVNDGNYIVKDKSSKDKLLEFNFKTVDVTAKNVDILADNKCEGAELTVNGIEKDGTKSVRTYKVKNGKVVLNSADDKKVPNLPDVEISPFPEGLEDNSNSIEVAVSEANEELEKPEAVIPTKNNEGTLKVVEKNGKKVGSYHKDHKDSTGKVKEINSNITEKDNMICVVSFYGDDEFTFVFVIDYKDAKSPKVKGSIFKGRVFNKTIDSLDRIAQFAGKNGKITVITSEGSSEVSVQ